MSDIRFTAGADWSVMTEGWVVVISNLDVLYLGPNGSAPAPAGVGATVMVQGTDVATTNDHRHLSDNAQLLSTEGGMFYNLSDRTVATIAVGGTFGDLIQTGSANDTIDGGTGNDTLTGNAGADEYRFSGPLSGDDVINGFAHGTDKIWLSNGYGFTINEIMAQVSYSAGNAVIDLGNGDSITLNGVASGLDTSDFAIPNVAPFADIALGSYTATEQTALNLKGAAGNAVFLVGDSDSPFAIMTVTLSVTGGILNVTAGTSGATVTNSGTSTVTIEGTFSQINGLLRTSPGSTVEYINNSDTPPASVTMTLTINDNGNSGTDGPKTATDTATINIVSVNDAPTSSGFLFFTDEDTTHTFALGDFGFVDADGNTLQAILIDTLPPNGVLQLDGVTLTGPTSIDPALVAAGKLTYVPPADFNSSSGGSFDFRLQDNGGTANGGSDTSATTTAFIKILAVNDAPTITAPLSVAATEDQTTAVTGLSFADIDAGSSSVVVALSVNAGEGVLSASSGGGVAVGGSGSNAISLSGSLADINAFIAASLVSYTPAANANGDVALGVAVDDQGNTGRGGALEATHQTTLAIAAVDDPGTLSVVATVSAFDETADTSAARKVADITVTDIDGGSTLSLAGADKDMFEIVGTELFLKAGAALDFEANPELDVSVVLGGPGGGTGPLGIASLAIDITDVAEIINGNKKDNVLTGTAAAEIINGKGGDDTIKGGGGSDTIRGGAGADVMTGGAGPDVFVFKPGDLPKVSYLDRWLSPLNTDHDLIKDFTPGTDKIDLSAIDANTHKDGNQKFHFEGQQDLSGSRGELVYELYGSKPSARHTIVMGDVNGDGDYDFLIVLKGHHTLHASDFIL